MSTVGVIDGIDEMVKRLAYLGDSVAASAARGCTIGAERVLARAQADAPFKSGAMANSGEVAAAVANGGSVEPASVSFHTDYAQRQEEDESLNHPNGGKAHFLRDAIESCRTEVEDDIANAIVAGMGA